MTVSYQLQLQPSSEAPGRARRFIVRRTPESLREDVGLVVSELVTNAVIHRSSDDPIEVSLELDDRQLVVAVQQPGPRPAVDSPSRPTIGGRGLSIINALASTWGTGPSSVWAKFALQ